MLGIGVPIIGIGRVTLSGSPTRHLRLEPPGTGEKYIVTSMSKTEVIRSLKSDARYLKVCYLKFMHPSFQLNCLKSQYGYTVNRKYSRPICNLYKVIKPRRCMFKFRLSSFQLFQSFLIWWLMMVNDEIELLLKQSNFLNFLRFCGQKNEMKHYVQWELV